MEKEKSKRESKPSRLPPWLIPPLVGAGFVLAIGPIFGIIFSIFLGIYQANVNRLIEAAALFITCALGGGAAGVAYYFGKPLARRGLLGEYLCFVLIIETYLVTVTLCMLIVGFVDPNLKEDADFFTYSFHIGLLLFGFVMATVSFAIYVFLKRRKKNIY